MNNLTILSWNVNGLRKKYSENHLDWLTKSKSEIICVQETKGSEEQLKNSVNCFEDYYSHYSSYPDSRYAGVAIYSKIEPLSIDYKFGKKNIHHGRILKADYADFILSTSIFPAEPTQIKNYRISK